MAFRTTYAARLYSPTSKYDFANRYESISCPISYLQNIALKKLQQRLLAQIVKHIAIGARGQGFDSRAGEIRHRVSSTDRHRCDVSFFELCYPGTKRGYGAIHYTRRRNTASKVEDFTS